MFIINKYKFNNILILNFFISLMPLALIVGNLITNLLILMTCLLGLFTFKRNLLFFENKIFLSLISLFFIYLFAITLYNNFPYLDVNSLYKSHIIKSVLFFRYLVFFLIINKLIELKKFNYKLFILSCSFFSTFLAIDILIQIIFGKDLIGNEIIFSKPSGFFGSELIAGGYLQKFSFFSIFIIFSLIKNNQFKDIFIIFYVSIIFFLINISGNRMPALIYFISIIMFYLLTKNYKKIIYIFLIISTFFIIFFNVSIFDKTRINIIKFYKSSVDLIYKAPQLFYYNKYKDQQRVEMDTSGYLIHFNSGIQIWKKNKIFGHGLKSFQLNCSFEPNQTCNTHPHNYFIEIMVDTGLVGLSIIYLLYLLGLINFFKVFFNLKNKNKYILLLFLIPIFFEFFPIRSTGSFFTTGVASYIFLILPFFLNPAGIKDFLLKEDSSKY